MPSFQFPKGFLWGAATSSYQVEGDLHYNDWAYYAREKKVPDAGRAVDFYSTFERDFTLLKQLQHTAHRFSLEWSRIQPEEATFDEQAIAQYRSMLMSLREKNIKSVLTLHHFTNPLWFHHRGGWSSPDAPDRFSRYVERVAREFGPLVDYWITINEPLVFVYNGYIKGIWPPHQRSLKEAFRVIRHMQEAHVAAYHRIHEQCDFAQVSFAKHVRVFKPCPFKNIGLNNLAAHIRNRAFNHDFLEFCARKRSLDFLGLNYYTLDFVRWSASTLFGIDCLDTHHTLTKNTLGWYNYPEGLCQILKDMRRRYRLPMMITENGTSATNDSEYREYLVGHIKAVAEALRSGCKVMGYLWWSYIDNFEWDKGYTAQFGLVEVDGQLARKVRPFALVFSQIAAHNTIDL